MLDEHKAEELELDEDERELLAHLSLEEQRQLTALGESRREFLGKMSATGAAILAAKLSAREQAIAFSSGEISEAIAPSAELENSLKDYRMTIRRERGFDSASKQRFAFKVKRLLWFSQTF